VGMRGFSAADQKPDSQGDARAAAGAERVFADWLAGTVQTRPALYELVAQFRSGNVVVVMKDDRPARCLKDLLELNMRS
jgi:DNA invertase Pin-like site-specific DNA recombinase